MSDAFGTHSICCGDMACCHYLLEACNLNPLQLSLLGGTEIIPPADLYGCWWDGGECVEGRNRIEGEREGVEMQ